MTQEQLWILDYCKANAGTYVYVHIYPDRTSGIQNHTFSGIYLGPTGDMQDADQRLTGSLIVSSTLT